MQYVTLHVYSRVFNLPFLNVLNVSNMYCCYRMMFLFVNKNKKCVIVIFFYPS